MARRLRRRPKPGDVIMANGMKMNVLDMQGMPARRNSSAPQSRGIAQSTFVPAKAGTQSAQ